MITFEHWKSHYFMFYFLNIKETNRISFQGWRRFLNILLKLCILVFLEMEHNCGFFNWYIQIYIIREDTTKTWIEHFVGFSNHTLGNSNLKLGHFGITMSTISWLPQCNQCFIELFLKYLNTYLISLMKLNRCTWKYASSKNKIVYNNTQQVLHRDN